ncbi:hypothetical protein [Parabacteroides chinchillae]|uniref:hypothetical protein n=1 Tax=Parabacteroides chinchillae TaxID=871327 RepID=UPI001F384315|nr:hypothetical protein [Parabacteroides chinchillae]
MIIPTDSLRNLPTGAVYEKKSGQATLKLGYKDGNIIATATCDSLQQLVYTYEEELSRLKKENTELQEQIKPPENPFKWYLYGVLTGIILTIASVLIIKHKRK